MKLKSSGAQVVAAISLLATVIGMYAFVQAATADRYRCWDGSREAETTDCPMAHGKPGLPWLFPSLEPTSGCEFTRPVKSRKTAVYVCAFRTHRGQGLIRYTAWTDPESAERYYVAQYGQEPAVQVLDDQGVGHEWPTRTYQTPRGPRFKRSGSFYDAAYSWSVEASSRSALVRGRTMLEVRPREHWAYDRELGFWERLKHGLSV